MDYSRDGTDQRAFTRQEIESLRSAGKIVLAHLSTREAEEYRFYLVR
jgi:cysteinyl-tRNA synthetase